VDEVKPLPAINSRSWPRGRALLLLPVPECSIGSTSYGGAYLLKGGSGVYFSMLVCLRGDSGLHDMRLKVPDGRSIVCVYDTAGYTPSTHPSYNPTLRATHVILVHPKCSLIHPKCTRMHRNYTLIHPIAPRYVPQMTPTYPKCTSYTSNAPSYTIDAP